MDVTKSHNPDSIVLASAKLELTTEAIDITTTPTKDWSIKDLTDLGLARGIKISYTASKIDIKADNGTVPLKGQTDNKARVEFSLLERHLPVMAKVMHGLVSIKLNAGTKDQKTEEPPANVMDKEIQYEFVHVSHDGAVPTNIVIKQGTKVLALGTDYKIEKNAKDMHCYKFLTAGSFDKTKATTIEYEITPLKSYTMGKSSGGVVKPVAMKLTNVRKAEDGRTISRIYEFPYGFYDGDDSIAFKSKNDADSVAEVPMAFEFSPHPDLILDAELETFSLSRETQEK